jgi:hypothetical protein
MVALEEGTSVLDFSVGPDTALKHPMDSDTNDGRLTGLEAPRMRSDTVSRDSGREGSNVSRTNDRRHAMSRRRRTTRLAATFQLFIAIGTLLSGVAALIAVIR